jgi:aminoglycoside phosphotransferase (APT) family kinase protein
MNTVEITKQDEENLKASIEDLVGGRVVDMSRQLRWRPSWFVDVEKDGKIIKIYARGDRNSDVVPFPDLRREANILSILGANGIPAPHIYGMCEQPPAIIMECAPGTRDVQAAADDDERRSVAKQYIESLVAMHRLPLQPFVEIGVRQPEGAEEIALAGLQAYWPLYEKHKAAPDPFIEFAIRWLRSNYPRDRSQASFIAFDAGQFMFKDGKITCLYDFEFSMIGDPMTDLATMAMRHSYEPMGEDIDTLCKYYGELSGEAVDPKVVRYHHALFSAVACMQFIGTVVNPKPGDPHDVYLEWGLALRRTLLNALADSMNVKLEPPPAMESVRGANHNLYVMLRDLLARIDTATPMSESIKAQTVRVIEFAAEVDRVGQELTQLALRDAEPFVGACDEISEMRARLETFVQITDEQNNAALLQLFSNDIERQVMAFEKTSIGQSAAHIRLESLA